MRQFRYKQYRAKNPLASILAAVFAVTVVLLSLALGFFVFIGAATFLLIIAAVMNVRKLWSVGDYGSKKRTEGPKRQDQPQIIEGEYREVDDQQTDRRNH